jgi:hypothetical protein
MNNNPVRYKDPTGNSVDCGILDPNCDIENDGISSSVDEEAVDDLDITIDELTPDAWGFRVNASAGYYIGANISVDLVWNTRSEEFDIFLSVGPQGYTEGGSLTIGGLAIWNLTDNQGYEGWSGGANVSVISEWGIEGNLTIAFEEYQGERPTTFYIGVGGGAEVTAPITVSHTWNIDDVFNFFVGLIK